MRKLIVHKNLYAQFVESLILNQNVLQVFKSSQKIIKIIDGRIEGT